MVYSEKYQDVDRIYSPRGHPLLNWIMKSRRRQPYGRRSNRPFHVLDKFPNLLGDLHLVVPRAEMSRRLCQPDTRFFRSCEDWVSGWVATAADYADSLQFQTLGTCRITYCWLCSRATHNGKPMVFERLE